MWYSRRESMWGGTVFMGRPYKVQADGLLIPQPGLEDMADLQRMRSLPTHYVFRAESPADDAEAEFAGEAAEKIAVEPPKKSGGRKKKETT